MARADLPKDIVLADTATKLGPDAPGGVIVTGSHGGRYAAYLTLKARPRAVVHNDAGVGKDQAGLLGAFENRLGVGRRRVNRRLRDAHRARDTQRRRASYAQRADRFRDRVGVDERPVFQSARQRGLVDDDDVSVAPLDRSHKRRV